MKAKSVIETESGKLLTNPNDGFVFCGVLYKGDGEGGLIGDTRLSAHLSSLVKEEDWKAFTNFEFFDALALDPEVFLHYYEARKLAKRSFKGISD